jgi:Xaa-Pro aminopeptidase
VRVEDDLVITAEAARLLSGALPRTPDAIEAWMGVPADGRRPTATD